MSSNSPQSSPSLLTYLRQYRFQRKPNVLSSSTESNSGIASTTSNLLQEHVRPDNTTYKRIRVVDSSSESESSSPPKKVTTVELTGAIKERRYRNMVEMFPDISTLIVKNTLLKHNWNEERCRDELLDFDPEHNEKPQQKQVPTARNNGTYVSNAAGSSGINISRHITVTTVPNNKKPVKKKRGRNGSDSDSDYGSRRNNGDKVYDSDEDSDVEVSNDLTGDKKKVFEFLNTSKMNELTLLNGCSQKKAEAIMSVRPFKGWVDMVDKFQENKHLSTDLLNATQELLSTRNSVQKLMKKCTSLSTQLESAVAAGAGVQSQPSILEPSLKLASYQMIGLNWLVVLHRQGVSGILADEMGLGKTVQVISFLAHLKETGQANGTHLVVVPASTLDNWGMEFARWCPSMNVSMYYGHPDDRRALRISYARGALKNIDVILTTYTMVSSCPEEKKMFRVTPLDYVIFDEAHMLKNMATQRYDNLIRIQSKHRILMTGTPLQNNLLELMSLLCFVMPHIFKGKTDDLKNLFQKNSKSSTRTKKPDGTEEEEVPLFEQSQITQAKRIMRPFVLRRLKRDVLKDLPRKTDHTVSCAMSDEQQRKYKELIESYSAQDGVIHSTNEQSGMSMMMEMRKLANHPLLLRHYYTEEQLHTIAHRLARDSFYKENNEQYVYEDLMAMSDFQIHQMTFIYKSIVGMKVPDPFILDSGKFAKLDSMLPRLKAEGHRVLIFSQFVMMLDIIEPYLKLRGYEYLRLDGSTAVTSRQELIDQYNKEDIFVFLLSTKAGGLGINLTAADTVIIHDIDFNPYNDKQAEDRCHRLGQLRPVTIYRFISTGTIEEGIYQVAQEKLSLERDITNTDENQPQEMKNVVRLLTLALGLTSSSK